MKTKWLIYGFITGIIPLGFWAVSTLKLETDINAYNLASGEGVAHYESFVRDLGQADSAVSVIVLEKASGWDKLADFKLLEEITDFWREQPEVETANSISDLEYPKKGFFRTQVEPFLDLEHPERFDSRMSDFELYGDVFEKFLSRDKIYTLLFVKAPKGIPKASAQKLEEIYGTTPGLSVHYIQYNLIQDELKSSLRRDTIWLAGLGLCLVLIGFFVFTQSLRGLALIGLMVAFNIALTFLVMYALQMRYTLHMITIPCIITVLSFTDIMHILYHQQKEHAEAETNAALQQKILAAVRVPLLLTSLTNIVGFSIFLIFAENVHLFNFSLAAMVGVAIAYLSARFLVIRLMDKQNVFIKRKDFHQLYSVHNRVAQWFWQRKNYILPAFLLAFAGLLWLVKSNFSIDGSEQEYALSDSKLTRGAAILQAEFFGKKQAEVFITCQEGSIWDKAQLDQLEQVESVVKQQFKPLFINSPTVLVKRYHRYLRNGNPRAYFIPEYLDADYVADLNAHKDQLGGSGIIDSSATKARIVFGFEKMTLPAARKAYAQLRIALARLNGPATKYELSGLQYLSDEATHRFSMKILLGLLLSILFGSALVWLFMRSIRQSLGVLLVNLFPLIFALGSMLYLGLSITPLTLFFLSILLGVCVDDSIYLIVQHKKRSAELHVLPIFITSFVLSLGFLSLAFSSFKWIQPFGWIFLLGIASAYLLDLFVLPIFLNRKATFGPDG